MKITLLEHPRKRAPERANDIANTTLSSCLNSGYAMSVLKAAGHEVEVIEGYMDQMSYPEIFDEIQQNPPDVLFVHMVYNWDDSSDLYDFLRRVKWETDVKKIGAYGYYATFAAREIMNRCLSIDYILYGEFERSIVHLLDHLDDPILVRGVAFRDEFANSGIRISTPEIIEDLDALPFPVRTHSSMPGGEANILGSRGCYGNCTFCYINPYYGLKNAQGIPVGRWRPRSPENIVEEMKSVMAETGADYFYFTDPNFFGPGKRGKERVMALAEKIKPLQVRFGIEARADDIDQESIRALADAGLDDILVGLESGRDEALARLNKHTTVRDNEHALEILRENGIEPSVGFIMFEPDSALEDIRTNLEFLKRNRLLDRLERTINVLYHHQILLKGSPAYDQMKAQKKLVLSPHNSYEGETVYEDESVGALAEVMRRITNHFFSYMEKSYLRYMHGETRESAVYEKANGLLVQAFEEALHRLEESPESFCARSFSDQKILALDRIIRDPYS